MYIVFIFVYWIIKINAFKSISSENYTVYETVFFLSWENKAYTCEHSFSWDSLSKLQNPLPIDHLAEDDKFLGQILVV